MNSALELNRWYRGKTLERFMQESDEARLKQHRFCYKSLMGFLLTKRNDICALTGIRRTGKTVLMIQAMRDLMEVYHISAEKIAYITIGENNGIDDVQLLKQLEDFAEQKIRYVFIDEISYIQMDLENNTLNLLTDRLAKVGMKVVIAGTFSYALKLLAKETLFDRMHQIDTTYFSYKEAHDVFGQDIDTFLKYGGVINFDEKQSISPMDYMETAIVSNIVKSIFKSERRHDLLMTLPEEVKRGKNEKELKTVIAGLIRIAIDQYLRVLVVGKLVNKSNYRFSDVGKLASVIRQRSEQEQINDEMLEMIHLDTGKYYRILADYLGNSEKIPEETFRKIIQILEEIQVKREIYLEGGKISVFVPNYLRYGLCDRIVKAIADEVREETGARYNSDLAGEILLGSIQEAVCYLDLKMANQMKFDMYRSADGSCEIDLILFDSVSKQMDLYEIKHSSEQLDEQAKHLVNREFIREIEQVLGYKTKGYHILYNGSEMMKEIDPVKLYQSLENKCIALGKMANAEKWERLKESAAVQEWNVVEVKYHNIEKFLCELAIVQ